MSVCRFSLYFCGCGNPTTCACLLSTTWPPGRMAIITRNHGDGAIGSSERHGRRERRGVKGGDPLGPADTMSVKHKGDSWRWGRSGGKIRAEGRKSQKEEDGDSFLCLPHCLPARSLPLPSYLAVLPLTSSQRPLSFFISFVALPPSHSLFTSFCLAFIYLELIAPPSSLHLPPYSLLGLPFPPSRISGSLSLHQPSPLIPSLHYYQNGCCGNTFIWKWREENYACALSADFDTTV